MPGEISETDRVRFWTKVQVGSKNECWPWVAYARKGRGNFKLNGVKEESHKVALIIKLGRPLLDYALHTCDNGLCCNPDHLYEGTQQQNIWDSAYRLRARGNETKGIDRKGGR